MSITRYETALRALNATKFEELIHEIILREYGQYDGFQIEHIGKTHGKEVSAKGTPDIWFSYKKEKVKKCVFVEITTQTSQLFSKNGKVTNDLQKCKKKIEDSAARVDAIIYACTSSIDFGKLQEYDEYCKSIGCEFVFWGIDTILSILKLKYQVLIPSYLGIQINKGNVISIQEFIKSNKFGVTEENKFLYRETDCQKVIESLLRDKTVILSGAAGCGKTRLALEIANSLRENNNFETYWIKLCNIDVVDDIINSVSTQNNCLIVIDDANRLSFVRDILNFAATRNNIYLILTVRDYAIEVVKNGLSTLSFSHYQLLPLTNDQIKEVIRQGFNINNSKWLEYILSVSKGNLRFAIMTTEILTKKSAKPTSIDEVLKTYYQEIYRDINLQADSKLENFLVAVSFFKRFDMRDKNLIATISEVFSFERNKFYEYVRIAEENELINLHFDDYVVEIADQILADYLCYKIIVLEKKVSLIEVFQRFFTQYENKFVDVIQSLINIYGYDTKLISEIKQLKKLVQNINDDYFAIQFFKYFANIFPDESLQTCNAILSKYEGESLEFSKFEYSNVSRAIDIICAFHENSSYVEIAIDYLIALLKSKENLCNIITGAIKESFTINKDSYSNKYNSQITLLKKAIELVKESDGNYTDVLFTVAEMLYPLEVEAAESKGSSVVFYRIRYANCPEFKNLRQLFWKAIGILNDYNYTEKLTKLLYNNAYGLSADYELRNIDKDYAVEIYNSIDNCSLKNRIFKFALLSPYRKMEEVKPLCGKLLDSFDMKLYSKYICNLTSNRLYGKQLQKELFNDLDSCDSANEIIETLIELENVCGFENSWDLSEVINGAFDYFYNNFRKDYDHTLITFLDDAPNTNCQPLNILKKVNNKSEILFYLQASNLKNKYTWIAQFYFSLKFNEIDDSFYESAKLFFTDEYYLTTSRWGNEQLINLEAFEKYKPGLLLDILKYCNDNQVASGPFIETIFYDYKPIDEIIKLFCNNVELLGEIYLSLIGSSHCLDLNGKFAKYLISYDQKFLKKIIVKQLNSHNDYYRLKNIYCVPNFIDELVSELKSQEHLNLNFGVERIISELTDELYLDFLNKYVSSSKDNKSALFNLTCITRGKDCNQITLLDCLIRNKVSTDIILKLPIFDGPSSWSGSLVPYLKETLSLLDKYIDNNKNLPPIYKSMLSTLRERLKEYIKNTEIYEFNDDRFGN